MKALAADIWHVPLGPRDTVNAYVLGDVPVDAGYKLQAGRAVAAAKRRGVREHALTHAHLDHAGGSARVCRGGRSRRRTRRGTRSDTSPSGGRRFGS